MRFKFQWLIALVVLGAAPLLASCGAGSNEKPVEDAAGKSSKDMPIVTNCESDASVSGRCMN